MTIIIHKMFHCHGFLMTCNFAPLTKTTCHQRFSKQEVCMHTLFPGVAVFLRSRVFERIFATTIDSLQTCVSACVCVCASNTQRREREREIGGGGKETR